MQPSIAERLKLRRWLLTTFVSLATALAIIIVAAAEGSPVIVVFVAIVSGLVAIATAAIAPPAAAAEGRNVPTGPRAPAERG